MFDDIGEELDRVMVYGSYVELGKDVLTQRHEEFTSKGSLTFGTSNLNMKQLEDKYGYRVGSRVHEMFNVFIRKGEDMRKEAR
jgi:DNA replication protein DnaC